MIVSATMTAFVMAISEQNCATKVYEQSDTSDADRLVKMNFQWNKEPVDRFAGH